MREFQATPYTFFLSETRKPIEPRTVQHRLTALFKNTDLKITFAKLREMFVDRCFDMDMDLAAISKVSGKKTFEIDTRKSAGGGSDRIRAVVMMSSEQ